MKICAALVQAFALFSILLFRPAQGVIATPTEGWEYVNPAGVPDARYGHSMVVMPGPQTLLFGGEKPDGSMADDLQIFQENYWSEVPPNGDTPPARKGHASWGSGSKMYIFGGISATGAINDLWTYDPSSNQWAEMLPNNAPPPARYGAAAWAYGDQLYVMGGIGEDGYYRFDVQAFDLNTKEWSTKIEQINEFPASALNAVGLYQDSIFVLGSFDTGNVKYNLLTNKMSFDYPNGDIPTARRDSAYAQDENRAWIMGGRSDSTALADAYQYDFTTETYTRLPDLPFPLYNAAAAYDGEQIIVQGGVKADSSLNDWTLLYGPDPGWQVVNPANAPDARTGHSMVVMPSNEVLAFGGKDQNWDTLNDMHLLGTDISWTELALTGASDLPTPREWHAAAQHNGKMYIAGGKNETEAYSDLFTYDPAANHWTSIPSTNPGPELYGQKLFATDDAIYQIGGKNSSGTEMRTVWELDTDTGEWVERYEPMPFPISNGVMANLQPPSQTLSRMATQAGPILFFLGALDDRTLTYDLGANTWGEIFPPDQASQPPYGTIPPARQYAAYAQSETKAWLFGGKAGTTILKDAWEFDLLTQTFTRLDDMPFPLYDAAAAFNGEKVILFGGKKADYSLNGLTLLYAPADFEVYLPLVIR